MCFASHSLECEPKTHIIYPRNTSFPYLLYWFSVSLCVTGTIIRNMTLKTIFLNFHIQFLNSDFSVHNESNVTKSIGHVLCIPLEERVSQNLDLGLGYFFYVMLKIYKSIFSLFFMFHIIQIKPGPKSRFRDMLPSRRMFCTYPQSFKCIFQTVNEKSVLKKYKYKKSIFNFRQYFCSVFLIEM